MDKLQDLLLSLGFKKNEVSIYLTLLMMGTSTPWEISKETKIHRSNVYDVLRGLVARSFVSQTNGQKKKFTARPLEYLVHFIETKDAELKEAIKDFQMKKTVKKSDEKIIITKGKFAFQQALFSFLESNETIYVYGIPKEAIKIAGPILKEFHKKRIKSKVEMKHIYNSDALVRAKQLNKYPFTEARILPEEFDSRVTTNIAGDNVLIVLWDDDITVVEIKGKNIANPYKNYFNVLWEKANVPV